MTSKNTEVSELNARFKKAVRDLPAKPKLANGVYLTSGNQKHWLCSRNKTISLNGNLQHQIMLPLLSLMDGKRTVKLICSAMPKVNPVIIHYFLTELKRANLLSQEISSGEFLGEIGQDFFELNAGQIKICEKRLKNSSIAIMDTGLLGKEGYEAFRASGIGEIQWFPFEWKHDKPNDFWKNLLTEGKIVERNFKRHDLLILTAHVHRMSLGLTLNRYSIKMNIPLLYVKFEEMFGSLSTVLPHVTACLSCQHLWRRANDSKYEELMAMDDRIPPSLWPDLEPHQNLKSVMSSLTRLETIRLLTTKDSAVSLQGEFEINFHTMKSALHPVVKLPRCPDCSLHVRTPTERQKTPLSSIWQFDRDEAVFKLKSR